jgi:chromodomain-helicase-DNA-binding protein 1
LADRAAEQALSALFQDMSAGMEKRERLACRPSPSIPFDPTDPYANQEFFVKWRHWSYIHCSWDTRETLFQLAGYKRVKNYIKRMEDLDRKRRVLSREEIELLDVERQMEYEISLQHQSVRFCNCSLFACLTSCKLFKV